MSSQASSPTSPASIMEEISTRTMSDVVKDFNTEELIYYLVRKNLKLDKDNIKILRKEKISGLTFFELTEEKFRSIGLAVGPATILAKFIEGLSQKLRNYSSLKTLDNLKEMLHRNKVNGEDITNIKQFTPIFEEISDDDKAFKHSILHASIAIAKKLTSQDIFIVLQKDVSGKDATGEYAQNLAQLESAF
ncbi:hypothetical protein GLOIN_2v1778295 [Rhizophagus clarus]|uniref:SAM domain-containing protein n=1 Tax=Rhizophagus clarus TaxID=94130 RepID=A0A8H3KVB6_9GLOM|nr:hypothetical protein GLOIN_2v1778295 [Rhizophagus clarus]